jgi:hypothetical protein
MFVSIYFVIPDIFPSKILLFLQCSDTVKHFAIKLNQQLEQIMHYFSLQSES